MSLLELLSDALTSLFDSSGAPGDPGGWTTGGAGPAAGGMGDGGPGGGDGGDGGDGDGDDDGDGSGDGGDDGGGGGGAGGDPDDEEKGSWEDVEKGWEETEEWFEENFDFWSDFGERAAKGELTEDEKIVLDAVDTGTPDAVDVGMEALGGKGVPGAGPVSAASDAIKYAGMGPKIHDVAKAAESRDDKIWAAGRGKTGDVKKPGDD